MVLNGGGGMDDWGEKRGKKEKKDGDWTERGTGGAYVRSSVPILESGPMYASLTTEFISLKQVYPVDESQYPKLRYPKPKPHKALPTTHNINRSHSHTYLPTLQNTPVCPKQFGNDITASSSAPCTSPRG